MAGKKERAAASLWGLFMGDAVASPVHWYYDLHTLRTHFPDGIKRYEKPPLHLPGSILNLSSTGSGGRGRDDGKVVGSVILHDKREYWKRGGDFHYHCTLEKGENTLEAQLALRLLQQLRGGASFDSGRWLEEFKTFLTTPGTHNDTYASTYIRMFFANYADGKPLDECADNDGHNVDTIDSLTGVIPIAIAAHLAGRDPDPEVTAFLASTRRSTNLPKYGRALASMLGDLLEGHPLRDVASRTAKELFSMDLAATVAQSRGDPMTACYIVSGFPALLHFAHKYADSPTAALLASANAGGENVARGTVLGALLGAAHGDKWEGWLYEGLVAKDAIAEAIAGAVP